MSKELLDTICSRISCRQYLNKDVPKDLLEKVLDAGRRAPSGKNEQPWHFYVMTNFEKISSLGAEIQKVYEEKDPGAKKRAEEHKSTNSIFYNCPVVILCTLKKDGIATRYLDLGLAVENMMLMAEALGLSTLPCALSKWMGEDIITKYLKLPENEEFFLSLSLGYADPEYKKVAHERKPLSEVVTYLN